VNDDTYGLDRTWGCQCGCQDDEDDPPTVREYSEPKLFSSCCKRALLYDTEPCPACKRCNQCGVEIRDEAAFCKSACCNDELRAFCSPECFTGWHAPEVAF
jgi:hypothetical protein